MTPRERIILNAYVRQYALHFRFKRTIGKPEEAACCLCAAVALNKVRQTIRRR